MDDIINLGTFDFDLNRLNQNLDTARSRMFELNKQQEANKKQYREMQKEIDELVKVQGLLENSNAESSEAYMENEARIQALTEAQRANFKVQQDTATQISRVRTEINQTNTQLRL